MTSRRLSLLLVLTGLAVCMMSGCRRGNLPHVVPVCGTVLYRGQSLPGATVMFVTRTGRLTDGQFAAGQTDAQGRFRLTAHLAGNLALAGAVPGEHRVIISKYIPPSDMTEEAYQKRLDAEIQVAASGETLSHEDSAPAKVELLPAKYSSSQQSTLSVVVKEASGNDFRFELE